MVVAPVSTSLGGSVSALPPPKNWTLISLITLLLLLLLCLLRASENAAKAKRYGGEEPQNSHQEKVKREFVPTRKERDRKKLGVSDRNESPLPPQLR